MKYILIVFFSFFISVSFSQDRQHAYEVNNRLKKGINLGNMFEAPTETAWGNPYNASYPGLIRAKGFNHVRIPIRWETNQRSQSTPPYTIDNDFLNRIKEVVDANLAQGLMVIINMHHHEAIFENPSANKARFLAQWSQIATFFKDYSDDLLFEILNEPHGNMSATIWNEYLAAALTEIRMTNSNRVVLIGTASYGGLGGLSDLMLPSDANLIVTIHYYSPFSFTHQGAEWVEGSDQWLGTKWHDTQSDRDVVAQEMKQLKEFEENNNIPVHIGEFGAYNKADENSRLKWTTFLSRYFEQMNWSWAYWEFSAGFGIYNPDNNSFNENLSNALLINEMPDPTTFKVENIYSSDFSNDFDGWVLNSQGGASSNLSKSGDALKVTIINSGTTGWHIQLTKNNFELKKGETYQLKFRARCNIDKNTTAYVGLNKDPWSQYGSSGVFISAAWNDYQFPFEMNSDDGDARIVFDLGNSLGNVEIKDVILNRVLVGTLSVDQNERQIDIFPNPVKHSFNYFNEYFQTVKIYDLHGRVIKTVEVEYGPNEVVMNTLKPGVYFAIFNGSHKSAFKKIIKL